MYGYNKIPEKKKQLKEENKIVPESWPKAPSIIRLNADVLNTENILKSDNFTLDMGTQYIQSNTLGMVAD